jgi:hypothetical protein
MPTKRHTGLLRRRAVWATGLATALAIAAPVGEASADLTPVPALRALPALGGLPAIGELPAFTPAPLGFVGLSIGHVGVAMGPTVIGSVFNGGTTVVVSSNAAAGNTIGSP